MVLQFIENNNTLIQLTTYLKLGFEYILTESKSKCTYTIEDKRDFANIVEPRAKDRASPLNIATVNGDLSINIHWDSKQTNMLQIIVQTTSLMVRLMYKPL